MWRHFHQPCFGKWVRSICHFGVGDVPGLTSSPHLIANKFSYGYQPLAYDCVEKWYFDKVAEENKDPRLYTLNITFYESLDFMQNRYRGPVKITGV